jgi:hypothetical protein
MIYLLLIMIVGTQGTQGTGTFVDTPGTSVLTRVLDCEAGKYYDQGDANNPGWEGSYSTQSPTWNHALGCLDCPAGKIGPASSRSWADAAMEDVNTCKYCRWDEHQPIAGQSSCTPCTSGIQNDAGTGCKDDTLGLRGKSKSDFKTCAITDLVGYNSRVACQAIWSIFRDGNDVELENTPTNLKVWMVGCGYAAFRYQYWHNFDYDTPQFDFTEEDGTRYQSYTLCHNILPCTNTDGLQPNTKICECPGGTSTCDPGLYCNAGSCQVYPQCTNTYGLQPNTDPCMCVTEQCSAGSFCNGGCQGYKSNTAYYSDSSGDLSIMNAASLKVAYNNIENC